MMKHNGAGVQLASASLTPVPPHAIGSRDKHLDGMRGCAALIVLTTHTLSAFWPTAVFGPQRSASLLDLVFLKTPLALLTNGMFAVCLFFILSGYVLTRKYFLAPPATIRALAADIGKRFPRLYTAALPATLAAALLMWFRLYYNVPASMLTHSQWLASLRDTCSTKELVLAFANPVVCLSGKYNPVAWSLFVELWGSVAAFCLVIATSQLNPRGRLACVLLVVVCSRLAATGDGDTSAYGYLGFFAIGVAFADWEQLLRGTRFESVCASRTYSIARCVAFSAMIGLSAIPYYAFADGEPTLLPWLASEAIRVAVQGGPAGLLAIVVFAVMMTSSSTRKLLSYGIPCYLGRISVGLYLVHMPLLCTLGSYVVAHHIECGLGLESARLIAAVSVIMASLGLGAIYSIVIDDTAVSVSHRIGQILRGKPLAT